VFCLDFLLAVRFMDADMTNPIQAVAWLYQFLGNQPRPRHLTLSTDELRGPSTDDLTRNPTMNSDFDFQVAPYMFTPDFIKEERRLTARQPHAVAVRVTRTEWRERYRRDGSLKERIGPVTVYERMERF
jgi:hypothetical protein